MIFIFRTLLLFIVVGCSRDVKNTHLNDTSVTTKSVNLLKMDCQGGPLSCNGTVGALLVFEEDKLNLFCTAFVVGESISYSVLATSSHCLKQIHHNLKVPTKINKDYIFAKYDVSAPNNVELFDINEVLHSNYNHTERLGLDYAYMSTFKRVNIAEQNIEYNSIEDSKLALRVTTATLDKPNLLISIKDHNNCSSVVDDSHFLKSLFYTPENFGIENCRFYPGNSGAPVFFNNTLTGILNSGLIKSNLKNLGFEQQEARQAYANNILCTEPLSIKKASQNSERPLFSQMWFCSPSFERTEEFSFLIKKTDHEGTPPEQQTHIAEPVSQ